MSSNSVSTHTVLVLLLLTFFGLLTAREAVILATEDNVPSSEINALRDLYVATNGEQWKNTSFGIPWNFTTNCNPCEDNWQGVSCDVAAPGQYRHVTKIELNTYNLRGSLPESIGNLTSLSALALPSNILTGSIPESIGDNLLDLTSLILYENHLDGTIPANLGNLQQLKDLVLNSNQLNGSIPSTLGNLASLLIINLNENQLTGTIPTSLGDLTSLKYLDFQLNQLTHTIPTSMVNMASIEVISLNSNQFSGTFPSFMCDMSTLSIITLYTNKLHDTIPPCVGNLTQLTYLLIYDNLFTRTIPESIGNLANLQLLWLEENYLTGSIPAEFGALNNMVEYALYGNHLRGTLPANLGGTGAALEQLALYDNHFTGSLPEHLGTLTALQLMNVENNLFTGSIPKAFQGLTSVTELYLQSNRLSGSLDGVFNRTMQKSLAIIQLSYNQLTGTLPDEAFLLPQLNTFVAVSNCFVGNLPEAICRNPLLFSVILDGVQTAPACRQNLLPDTSNSYVVANNFRGTVPACLFNMPNLTSLHISGNGLSGSLPGDLVVSDRLVDLTISHNALTGTIPRAIQERAWKNLDLSFNRLNGSLIPDFGARKINFNINLGAITYNSVNSTYAVSLSLMNNRLSGNVPKPLVDPYNVTILGTNMFACRTDKSDLPKHDNARENYQCGSDSFDIPYWVFLIVVLVLVVLLVLAIRHRELLERSELIRNAIECLHKWTLQKEELPRNFKYVSAMSDILCKLSLWCTVLILVVLVPWYAAASHYYGTYTHQYGWVVSAAFLSGHVPLLVEVFFYPVLMVLLVAGLAYLLMMYDKMEHNQPSRYETQSVDGRYAYSGPTVTSTKGQRVRVYVAFAVINIIVVVGVNLAFVLIALYQSNTLLIIAQVVISLFKLGWNSAVTPMLIRHISEHISRSTLDTGFVILQVIIALFNNIAIPCLVVAVVSPSCFYNVFDAPPKVTSNFIYESCALVTSGNICVQYSPVVLSTTYNPPFRYDYQCSSSFVTYYAPAFVYLSIAAAFVTPIAKLVGHELYKRATPGTYWYRMLDSALPRIQKPIAAILDANAVRQSGAGESLNQRPLSAKLSMQETAHLSARSLGSLSSNSLSSHPSYEALKRDVFNPYFDANIYIISLMTYLGILLTFGVVFPPLAVAMSVTMMSVAWQGRLAVGRFLYCAREAGALKFVDIIEQECKGAVTIPKIRRSIFIIICFSCSFYALFLYDTLGNAVGQSGAIWTLIVMPLFPLLIYGVIRFYRERRGGLMVALKMEAAAAEQTEGVPMSALDHAAAYNGASGVRTEANGERFSHGSVASDIAIGGGAEDDSTTFNVMRV